MAVKDPRKCDKSRPTYWFGGDGGGEAGSGCVDWGAGGLGLAAATCLCCLGFVFAAGAIGASCAITGLGVSATVE
jgi:hypothetical protein